MTPFVERLFMLDDSFAGDSARLANYVRLMAGSRLSPLGGCAMGAGGAPLSVVDERGRVHGVSGLRIADASIVPITLHTGPALACVAIGERIAELMIEEVS
jgi:choline dehydrogenase